MSGGDQQPTVSTSKGPCPNCDDTGIILRSSRSAEHIGEPCYPSCQDRIARQVILDGRYFYQSHKDAWRAGVIVDEIEDRGPTQQFVTVECQPRGRERSVRRITACIWHLLKDTPEVRAKLKAHGIDPEVQR